MDFDKFTTALNRLYPLWMVINEPPPEQNNASDVNLRRHPAALHLNRSHSGKFFGISLSAILP